MKKIILFTLPLLLLACNSIEKHRSAIETLATNWSETTNQVTDFSEMLNGAMTEINSKIAPLAMTQDQMDNLKPDVQEKYNSARSAVVASMQSFGPIQEQLATFMSDWTAKTEVVTSLQSGLAEGKLDPAMISEIPALQEMVASAGEKVAGWKTSLDESKGATNAAITAMQAVYQGIMGDK